MITLALSTSTPRANVALVQDDRVLADVTYEDPRGHAERIFTLVDDALAAAHLSRPDIGLVACDIGPGSFTGVRIAVASAKGIAVGLCVPLAGVVSLEAMAAQAREIEPGHSLVAAAIDAKKDELYLALYDGEHTLLAPCHVPRGEVAARLAEVAAGRPFVSIVDATTFTDFAGPSVARALAMPPSASWVARLAAARIRASAAHDSAAVVPLYVRAPDAIPAFSAVPGPFDMVPSR